jgi:hypothetical protein
MVEYILCINHSLTKKEKRKKKREAVSKQYVAGLGMRIQYSLTNKKDV